MPAKTGDTALVLLVPEAEEVVGRWRERYDPAAAQGMPAHITVLYPFIPWGRIDDRVLRDIESIASNRQPIALGFSAFGEFPGVLWLDPESDDCRHLTESVCEQWPTLIPYGDPELKAIPHLTISDGASAAVMNQAREEIEQHLPFSARVESLALMAFDDSRWAVQREFKLGGG